MRVGLIPICSAEILCKLPNNTLEAVSEPVRATPSHPRRVPKKGYRKPVLAKVKPRVASSPEYLVVNPNANMAAMVRREKRTVLIVRRYIRNVSDIEYPIKIADIILAMKIPVPVADRILNMYTAGSALSAVTTGGTLITRLCKPGIGNLYTQRPSRKVLICGRPQMKTSTLRIIQGVQALTT